MLAATWLASRLQYYRAAMPKYCETQPSASKGWVALSFLVRRRLSRIDDILTYLHSMILPSVSCTNTQIHKYSIWWSTRKTQYVVYFWKEDCSRISKIIFPRAERTNTKIQIHKYTNTQIQHMRKCQKDPMCGIFLKRGLFKDIKNYIPTCRTHKYKNTNTQIHKYTNTAYEEVPERPNMWYIFEKMIVQGY